MVQIKEQLESGVLQEGRPPGCGDLDSAEIVRGLVSRRPDKVECETIVGQAEQLSHQTVLGGVVEVQVVLVLQS